MRVALLTTNLQPDNGWATVTVNRGAALMSLGVEVIALTTRGDAPPQGITPTDIRPVLTRPHAGIRSTLALLAANPAVARATADCDLIDAVCEPYALSCLLAARKKPLAVTAHGSYLPIMVTRGPARALYRAILRRAHVSAVSQYTARHVEAVLGPPAPPAILSGVDYDLYQAPRPRPDKRGPTILAVGAVKKRKGVHILINAMTEVRRAIPDVQCVVAGKIIDRGYVRTLHQIIAEQGLQDCVHLAGHLPYQEIIGWYQSADVFVMPSLSGKTHFEGFGLVILEAGACGVPAIGTRDSGNESAIVDGQTGFLIDQKDPSALAGKILLLLSDHTLRDRLGQGARAFARDHSWERSAREILAFYEGILADHTKGTR